MRILFLTQRFPFPPDRGDRIRSYNILKHLAKNHEISLASLTEEEIVESQWIGIKDLCTNIDTGRIRRFQRKVISIFYLPTMIPLTLPNYYSKELKEKIDRRLREESFDLIFVYCSSMAPYVDGYNRIPKVIDFVDVDSEKWFDYARATSLPTNLIYFREGYLLKRYEKRIAKSCRHLFVTSRREKNTLEQFLIDTPITTICNGVRTFGNFRNRRSDYRMIFTGVMDYWPNEDAVCHFVEHIFPFIKAIIPQAEFTIVGQKPTRRVKYLSKVKGVTVTGWVPDPMKYMEEASVFVAPIRVARGVQNKVLEAMACGVPVVATSAAANGLEAVEDKDFLLADSPDRFAEQTVTLLRDNRLREGLIRSAIEYIRQKHDWTSNINKMEDILVNVAELTN